MATTGGGVGSGREMAGAAGTACAAVPAGLAAAGPAAAPPGTASRSRSIRRRCADAESLLRRSSSRSSWSLLARPIAARATMKPIGPARTASAASSIRSSMVSLASRTALDGVEPDWRQHTTAGGPPTLDIVLW